MEAYIGRPLELVQDYSTSEVRDAEYMNQVTSCAEVHSLHHTRHHVLDDLESTFTALPRRRLMSNKALSCLFILCSYCCDIAEGKNICEFRRRLSARRRFVQCSSTVKDIRQKKCMTGRKLINTCQPSARIKALMSCLTQIETNITMKERRITAWLSKEGLTVISLAKWPSFMEALHHVQEDELTSA